jgi:hypothetical protein
LAVAKVLVIDDGDEPCEVWTFLLEDRATRL